MKNMITYLKKYGNTSFDELPFNEIDSLILSQIGYLNLDLFINDPNDEIFLKDVLNKKNAKMLAEATMTRKDNIKLCKTFPRTTRYDVVYYKHLISEINYDECEQFFGVSFFLKDFTYISYRGTDLTLAGWIENANMAYLETIPAQQAALDYLKKISMLYDKPLIVGGHSKGGNLALYASMYIDKEIQDRIIDVYDFDGPGFREKSIFKEDYYLNIEKKLHVMSSTMSVVAMLLYNPDKIEFLKTSGFTVLQHNPFNWHVKDYSFIRVKRNSITSRYFEKSVSTFFRLVSYEDRERFVGILKYIVRDNPKSSLLDIKRHPLRYFTHMRRRKKLLPLDDLLFYKKIMKLMRTSFKVILKKKLRKNKEKVYNSNMVEM